MTDSQLLLERLRVTPDDTTLLRAFTDALIEEGDEDRATLATELLTAEGWEVDRLRFLLGITKIEVGDLLGYSKDDGGVFPVKGKDQPHIFGRAMASQQEDTVMSHWFNGWPDTVTMHVATANPEVQSC